MKRNWASFLVSLLVATCCTLCSAWAATDSEAHRQALLAVRDGRNKEAIRLLTEAIRRNPTDYRLYNDRGVAYRRSGNLERALADYSRSLQLKPDFTNALNNRGVVYLLQGAPDKAISDLSKASESGGLEQKVQTNLGLALAAKGDQEAAIQSFKKALASGSRDPRLFLFMADSMEKTGAIDKALELCRLAYGFASDRAAIATIGKRIDRLEKQRQAMVSDRRQGRVEGRRARQAAPDKSATRKTPQARIILRAHPPGRPRAQVPTGPGPNRKNIESLEALESHTRSTAQAKLSPGAVDIFLQGRQFVEKSDMSKALVRFEDTRNLERRRRNYYAVAWSDLEIGRVLTRMGDHHKATAYFKEALLLFDRLRAPEEWILAALDLAANQEATGRKQAGAEWRAKAVQKAASDGYYDLARIIANGPRSTTAQGRQGPSVRANKLPPRVASPRPNAGKSTDLAFRDKKQPQIGTRGPRQTSTRNTVKRNDPKQWGSIGSGPIKWANSQPSSDRQASRAPARKDQPQGSVLSASRFGPKGHLKSGPRKRTEGHDLAELRRLRDRNDELGMVPVLERIAERLVIDKQYEKALHSLDAALGFRCKLQFAKGAAKAYRLRGVANEKLGRSAAAIEDLTRSLTLNDAGKLSSVLKRECRKLAVELKVDPDTILKAYAELWRARSARDGHGETLSLHRIAQIYSRAGHKEVALKYYERCLASMMADKARMYEEMGNEELAAKAYDEALAAFKELDYSRYVDLERRRKMPNTVSRQ